MKGLYRRLFWGTVLVILFSFGLIVARYINENLVGLGPIPARSTFAGRLPSIDGDPRHFQFFYATNRANTEETFNGQGNQLGGALLTGTFDVRISPYLSIKPLVWLDSESIKWLARNELPENTFHPMLRQAVQTSPQKSLLIIVWGFRDWFQSAALKTAYTAYVLDINTPVLLFDWPGNQGEGLRGYAAAREMSTRSGKDLGEIVAKAMQETGAERVWLMGSSLGCQTIYDSLDWLSNQPKFLEAKTKIDHVILSAPDVAADAFDETFSHQIQTLSKHLTAYVSSNDRALLMSQWLNGSRRLGRKTEISIPPEDRVGEYEFEEALELLDLQAKGARNISIVDATPINTVRNLHHFFTDSPIFFDELYQRLLQPDDIVNRRLHTARNRGQATYWILWND